MRSPFLGPAGARVGHRTFRWGFASGYLPALPRIRLCCNPTSRQMCLGTQSQAQEMQRAPGQGRASPVRSAATAAPAPPAMCKSAIPKLRRYRRGCNSHLTSSPSATRTCSQTGEICRSVLAHAAMVCRNLTVFFLIARRYPARPSAGCMRIAPANVEPAHFGTVLSAVHRLGSARRRPARESTRDR